MHSSYRLDPFPPIEMADEDGLLMVGGRLTPTWLIAAYRRGIFPWPLVDGKLEVLAWFCPEPRAVLELDQFHVPRRLARRLRRGEFQFTVNRNFEAVIDQCAAPRRDDSGTWITRPLRQAYLMLHESGYAHSIEVWQQDRLVGGLYGVALGGYFSGESMFHQTRDASKAGLAFLVERLRLCGFSLFDIQQQSMHMAYMGAREIPRHHFLSRLDRALCQKVQFSDHVAEHAEHPPAWNSPYRQVR